MSLCFPVLPGSVVSSHAKKTGDTVSQPANDCKGSVCQGSRLSTLLVSQHFFSMHQLNMLLNSPSSPLVNTSLFVWTGQCFRWSRHGGIVSDPAKCIHPRIMYTPSVEWFWLWNNLLLTLHGSCQKPLQTSCHISNKLQNPLGQSQMSKSLFHPVYLEMHLWFTLVAKL